jgi:integrase
MRFLTPAEIVDLAEAIHARSRALVFVGAYGGLGIGGLAGLRPSRVDLLAGAVTVAETLPEVKGKLIAGRPRRVPAAEPSGCRPSSSVSWRHILPPRSGPVATSSPPPVGAAAGPRLSGALLGAGYRGSRPAGPAHPRPSRHGRGAVDRRRRDAQGGRRARGAHLGQLHPGPLWPPDDPLAGRGGPVPSSKGLEYGVRQHGRKPQDARSLG